MKVVTPPELKSQLLKAIGEGDSVTVAVAYFWSVPKVLKALEHVKTVRVVVSSEWERNDVPALLRLHRRRIAEVRAIPHTSSGRLHAKLTVTARRGSPRMAILGSANMSEPGLTKNREVCVAIRDRSALQKLWKLANGWFEEAGPVDWDAAMDSYRNRDRSWSRRASSGPEDIPVTSDEPALASPRLWVMKVWSPGYDWDLWQEGIIQRERALILGWALATPEKLLRALRKDRWPKWAGPKVRGMIRRFWTTMNPEDRVLVTHGWMSDHADVKVQAWAEVLGPAEEVPLKEVGPGRGWRYRREARFVPIDRKMSGRDLRRITGLKACTQTLHLTNVPWKEAARRLGIKKP